MRRFFLLLFLVGIISHKSQPEYPYLTPTLLYLEHCTRLNLKTASGLVMYQAQFHIFVFVKSTLICQIIFANQMIFFLYIQFWIFRINMWNTLEGRSSFIIYFCIGCLTPGNQIITRFTHIYQKEAFPEAGPAFYISFIFFIWSSLPKTQGCLDFMYEKVCDKISSSFWLRERFSGWVTLYYTIYIYDAMLVQHLSHVTGRFI